MTPREEALRAAIGAANRPSADGDYYGPDYVELAQVGSDVRVRLGAMYERPSATFQTLSAIGEFFGTDAVDVFGTDSASGCSTCNHGSDYGVTFYVRNAEVAS